ncbi:MAG: menaquinone biosynthesis protein [Chitinophagaceae bacterium]|nr:menaquinone biosynthesis protein [Bacteroidota bacterium]MCC6259202.1 menaquinone biosynthesis protein [Chitinophagaceae bacterium]
MDDLVPCCWITPIRAYQLFVRIFAALKITYLIKSFLKDKIRVGSVSYLNALPLLYGMRQGMLKEDAELIIDYPSAIAADLVAGKIDVGLVPVAVIPQVKEAQIVTRYGIGCDGEVATVCLFSEVPLEEIKEVLLDYQSRTSVALVKLLFQNYWKRAPQWVPAYPGYESRITGTTAGLVIGDRAFLQRKHAKYMYDLGAAWKEFTGLPFLFAAWIANKTLPETFLIEFNKVNQFGLDHIPDIVKTIGYTHYDLQYYFTENIDYCLDKNKEMALKLFLEMISTNQ